MRRENGKSYTNIPHTHIFSSGISSRLLQNNLESLKLHVNIWWAPTKCKCVLRQTKLTPLSVCGCVRVCVYVHGHQNLFTKYLC